LFLAASPDLSGTYGSRPPNGNSAKNKKKTPAVGGRELQWKEPFDLFIRVPVGRFGTTSSKKVRSADKEVKRL